MKVAHRFGKPGGHYDGLTKLVNGNAVWTGKVRLTHEESLTTPLRWKRPRRIFVNSMSDLFHEDIPEEWIIQVFDIMSRATQHTFQVLTKRPERMRELMNKDKFRTQWPAIMQDGGYLPNVWLGVSAEDQIRFDERVSLLLQTPAAKRFISAEPLLGPIDITQPDGLDIDWIIAGGESGFGARPMDIKWVRSLRDDCVDNGIAFFFKQWGGVNKKLNGRELDGREWNEYP